MAGAERTDLVTLRAFLAIASRRSFRQAADDLSVAPSTLSHMMRGLEQSLGVRLLNRTTRSVAVTAAGETLLQRVQPLLRELDAALAEVDSLQASPSGRLRINASASAGRILLRRIVPEFLRRHPQMRLELVSEERLVDIVAGGFDAGVRLAEAVPQDMVAVPIGPEARFVAVAAPAYLRGRGRPQTPDDLRDHDCIRFRLGSGQIYRWEFERHGQALALDVDGSLTLDDMELVAQAAAAGLGIGFLPEAVAERLVERGELEWLLEPWCPPIPGLRLYYPGHRHVPAGLRAFIDTVKDLARSEPG